MQSHFVKSIALAMAIAPLALVQPHHADAQAVVQPTAMVQGTLLDVSATGSVSRVPDVAMINAGVETRAATASEAIRENSARMNRVRAALKAAGIADKDIQTSSINLNPDYRYERNETPKLLGYRASNNISIKFRDLERTGTILDALVAVGANNLSGPNLMIDKPHEALDEARVKAIANGKARAQLYAKALGMRVVRVVSVSEGGGNRPIPIMVTGARMMASDAMEESAVKIDPGEQDIEVRINMTFELR